MLDMLAELRWLSGDEVRVSGDVVPVDDEDGDMERPERLGEKAVRRRWREPERMGVKGDWKRLVRVGVTILRGGLVGEVVVWEEDRLCITKVWFLTIAVLPAIGVFCRVDVWVGSGTVNVNSSCPATRDVF